MHCNWLKYVSNQIDLFYNKEEYVKYSKPILKTRERRLNINPQLFMLTSLAVISLKIVHQPTNFIRMDQLTCS